MLGKRSGVILTSETMPSARTMMTATKIVIGFFTLNLDIFFLQNFLFFPASLPCDTSVCNKLFYHFCCFLTSRKTGENLFFTNFSHLRLL